MDLLHQVLAEEPHGLLMEGNSITWIFDSGVTITTMYNKADFKPGSLEYFKDGKIQPEGITGLLPIKGRGTMLLQIINNEGELVDIETMDYYIPDLQTSPQAYFVEWDDDLEFILQQNEALLQLTSHTEGERPSEITILYNKKLQLPTIRAYWNALSTAKTIALNACLTDEKNQNLTTAQKLLLYYHFKLGQTFNWLNGSKRTDTLE